MMLIILLSKNDLDALSTALRRMQPLTLIRTLEGVELTAEVRPAHPVWRVAMVIQVKVKEGRVQWVQTFDNVQELERCYGSFSDRIQHRLGCFRGPKV